MGKQLYSQRYIMKIKSSRLKDGDKIKLNPQFLRENDELISLGDSQILRFIRDIRNMNHDEKDIYNIKRKIKKIKRELTRTKNTRNQNRSAIKELYEKLDDMLFIRDYIAIVFENKNDFNKAVKKDGVIIDGVKFKRIIGTTGGVKSNTVMFCNEEIHQELNKRLENGYNKQLKIVPAKFEAYKSLATSVSTPVTMPNKILVIKDGQTQIKDSVIKVFDDGKGGFSIDEDFNYEATKEFCDGCGMIRKDLADKWAIDLGLIEKDSNGDVKAKYTPSGFNTRYAYNKGMVFTFPFDEFSNEVAKNNIVVDAWGYEVDIREVDLVLTTNMLKLWNAYDNIEHYLNCCKENGYLFSIAKVIDEKLEDKRNTNYQYLQSYELEDDDIRNLASETIKDIKGAIYGDYKKAILFSKGIHITDKNINNSEYDFIRALMIDKRMINDPFVKQRIYSMIEKRIQHAKKGVLSIDGNYSIISGDLYALCESMFGMEVKGLLKFGEFYNRHWLDKSVNEVIAFRSPMTSHNNIRRLKFIDNEKTKKWYRYMSCVTVFNAWDTTCDALNGSDQDGDAIITTNNDVILRNTRDLKAIVCEQKSVEKVIVKESLLRKANKNGFGDEIGAITNRVTAMFEVISNFKKESDEYKELTYRIICGQAYQQEAIDKIKGIEAKKMPKEWFDYKINKAKEDDDDETLKLKKLNRSIMANKKPYFFIYNYDHLMKKYKKFKKDVNNNCLIRFGVNIEELESEDLTEKCVNVNDESIRIAKLKFLDGYKNQNPLFTTKSTMNKIARYIENEFKDIKIRIKNNDNFDNSILKSEINYNKHTYDLIKGLYKDYKSRQKDYMINAIYEKSDEKKNKRDMFLEYFKQRASEICPNAEELCNIVVDMIYKESGNKQFVWDVCGEQIIENLLNKNNRKYHYPILDENGDIEWKGYKFSMREEVLD